VSGMVDFFKSLAGVCETGKLNPSLWSLEHGAVKIKIAQVPELEKGGGSVYLKGKGLKIPILIVCDRDNRFLAFGNRCTHIGHRKLDPVPGKRELRCCSVSHSVYDYDGNPLRGPARRSLIRYNVEYVDDELVVDLQNHSGRVP